MLLRVYQALFLTALSTVFLLALLPADDVLLTTGWDKANHFIAFITLAALLDIGYPRYCYWPTKVTVLLGIGVMIECLQWLTQYRTFSMNDVLADFVAIAAYYLVRPYFRSLLAKIESRYLSAWR